MSPPRHPQCPLKGLCWLTHDDLEEEREEEDVAPACPPLFLPPTHPFVQHNTPSSWSLETVYLSAGNEQTLTQPWPHSPQSGGGAGRQ